MIGQTLFDQSRVCGGEIGVIQFKSAAYKELAFGNAESWQFCEEFIETHGMKCRGSLVVCQGSDGSVRKGELPHVGCYGGDV